MLVQNAYNGTYAGGMQAWWDSFDQDRKVYLSVLIKNGYGVVLMQIRTQIGGCTYVDTYLDPSASMEGSKTWFCTFQILKLEKNKMEKITSKTLTKRI